MSACRLTGVHRRTNPPPKGSSGGSVGGGSLVDVGPQGLVQPLERGSVKDVTSPTTHHQLEERRRAEWGGVEEDLEGR